MIITRHINSIFNSNTYILEDKSCDYCWLIDIGDAEPFLDKDNIKGIFLTHTHFDHIYGINKIIEKFPDCTIYTSKSGSESLYSDKLNLSKYHESPLIFKGDNVRILNENDKIELFPNIFLEVKETPGHCPSCLTYYTDNYIFTGDSYIPNIKVVTNLPKGNKVQAQESVENIKKNIGSRTICPGHGEILESKVDNLK